MEFEVSVASANLSQVNTLVDYKGADVKATINCLEVEVTPVDGTHGTWTLRFVGQDLEPAQKLFKAGQTVKVKFS